MEDVKEELIESIIGLLKKSELPPYDMVEVLEAVMDRIARTALLVAILGPEGANALADALMKADAAKAVEQAEGILKEGE